MNVEQPTGPEQRPDHPALRLDAACDRFEAAWKEGRRPRIEDFLGEATESERTQWLQALLDVELDFRRDAGEAPTPDEYHRRFPRHPQLIADAFDDLLSNADHDASVTYVITRPDGNAKSLLGPEGYKQLRAAFAQGTVLQHGRYVLRRELGRGGMGQVFLGNDARLDRLVAIKVMLPPVYGRGENDAAGEARLQEEFVKEARLGANLTHPAIATVFDFGFHGGKPFTVFEYIPGETLADLLRRRKKLPLDEVRLILGPLAQALDFAHARHVVHRDLKPANIRANEQGSFKVLDLGLAKDFLREADWECFAGTPAYAAPEQAACLVCDGRVDQYALALIAYELLTGLRLFTSDNGKELLHMHRSVEPTWLDQTLADVPPSVHRALIRALKKSPGARFATCSDFAVALGCQLLNTPHPPPEILLETDAPHMVIGWLGWRIRFGWWGNPVHLVLTHEALWSTYHNEVHRFRLEDVEMVATLDTPTEPSDKAVLADVEAVRRAYREREADIRFIGIAHYLALIPIAIMLAVIALLTWRNGIVNWDAWSTLTTVLLGLLGVLCFVVGRGLRRLRPWARWISLTGALVVSPLAVSVVPTLLYLPVTRGNGLVLLLLLTALGAPFAYSAYLLASRKAAAVCSKDYRAIIEQTRHLNPPRAFASSLRRRARTLRVKLHESHGGPSRISFRFATKSECLRWTRWLASLIEQRKSSLGEANEDPPPNPVVLLRQRPQMRYQVLGAVEAKADVRRVAEAGLQVRAAMVGADAVLEVHEEILPDFHRTMRRLSGMAVRAVDADGRFEFRSRWYADRIARIGTWMIVLLLTSIAWSLFISLLIVSSSSVLLWAGLPDLDLQPLGDLGLPTVLAIYSLLITAIPAWPVVLTILLRWFRWPQLVRPLVVSVVALFSIPGLGSLGMLLVDLITGHWNRFDFLAVLSLLDPRCWTCLLFGLFLCRTAWLSDRVYRRLVNEIVGNAPWPRVLGGRLAWAGSVLYASFLAAMYIGGGFASVYLTPDHFGNK
jgi:serine/threonine protein kinase